MAAGEFNASQEAEIDRAIRGAETTSRFEFSVFVGTCQEDSKVYARRLHAALSAADRSVLILVDPTARLIEVVLGSVVRRSLSEDSVRLAIAGMKSSFAAGDLVGGIKHGVNQLAQAARQPTSLHEQPQR